jgi:hypothetical protein
MAWIRSRRRKDGTTIQQVNWRDRVSNKQYAETFADQITAKAFLRDVEAAGEAWPPDWVPGLGYPQPDENPSGYTVRTACIKAVEVNQRANSGTIVRPETGGPKTHYYFDEFGNFGGSW